jgi:type II secretion system protein N
MNRTAKFILYVVYSVAVVVFFLVVLFPSQPLKRMIIEQVALAQPEIELQTETVRIVFPPGLKLAPIAIAYAGIPVIKVDQVKLIPSLVSFVSQTKHIGIRGDIGSGALKGQSVLIQDAKRPQTKMTLNLSNVPIAMLSVANQWPQFRPSGEINAFIDYDSRRSGAGGANINLEATLAAVTLTPAVMGLERLEFSKIESEITLTPRMMQIKRFSATGLQIDGKLTGSVIFRQPLGNSRITMSCTLKPQPAFVAEHKNDLIGGLLTSQTAQKRGIIFRISGTLDNPKYVMR